MIRNIILLLGTRFGVWISLGILTGLTSLVGLGMITKAYAQEERVISAFMEANEAYNNQDYAKAVELYQGVITQGTQSGHLYYNLGNAHYRLGNLGLAIGYYLQALVHLPRNEDVLANLNYLRQQTKDQKESTERSWRNIANDWTQGFTLKEWLWSLVILHGLFWGALLLRLFFPREAVTWLVALSGAFTVFLVIATILRWWAPHPVGVILPQTAAIRSAPHAQTTVLFELHEGTEVTIATEEQEWIEIQFDSEKKGWVERQLLFIVLPHDLTSEPPNVLL